MLRSLRFASRLAAASSAAVALHAVVPTVSFAEPEPPAKEEEEKKKTCHSMTLIPESTATVLGCYPPEFTRVVADRVLIRPCMTEAHEAAPLRPLAVVEDGSSQSLLIVPVASVPLWYGPPDAGATGRIGYPVLPISITEEEEEQAPPPPPPPPAASEGGAASSATPASSTEAAELPPQAPTLWEQIEEPWRMLEAAGILTVERDDNSMPSKLALPDGAVAWQGELPVGPGHASADGGATRTVTVRLIGDDAASRLALRGRTAVPECGFCKFMKAGPCGEQFIAWEACVDAARDSKEDFVEACGKPTLALKACTDKHPEYYGELSDGAPADDDEDAEAAPPSK